MESHEFRCLCDGCETQFFTTSGPPAGSTVEQWRQYWKTDAHLQGDLITCGVCGCAQRVHDDGVPASEGGFVHLVSEEQPRIDSIGEVSSGPVEGGTVVRIHGHAFGHASPTVLFGGLPALSVNVIDDSTLDVETPMWESEPGPVDVAVENTFGRRSEGAVLPQAFEYTA